MVGTASWKQQFYEALHPFETISIDEDIIDSDGLSQKQPSNI